MHLNKWLFAAVAALIYTVPSNAASPEADTLAAQAGDTVVISLSKALEIALSENVAVKVADREIERSQYARKGTYASLFPQINASGSYQRTIKKQVMYMGGDDDSKGGGMSSMFAGVMAPVMYYINQLFEGTGIPMVPYVDPNADAAPASSNEGFEVGRWNTWSGGVSAAMPLVNAQLWQSIGLSGDAVELAVEKARESRLGTVTSVKQAYFGVLLAKEAFNVYRSVYENALENLSNIEKKYNVQKASELDLTRAKTNLANAIPNVYNAESSIIIALWQLKAVMGIDLDTPIDVEGALEDYASHMFYDINEAREAGLERNTTMRQLSIQAEQLAKTVRLQQYAYIPTLALNFSYSMNAMTNDFKFSEYKWTPYSFVGVSLSIPIFSGGKRYFDVKQAKVQAAELDLQRINTERQLKIAIRQSLQTMETAMRTHIAAEDALGSAEKAYSIAARSYDVGRSTLTDLDNAQLALTQARLGVCQAIFNFVTAKAALEQTLGYDFLDEEGNVDLDAPLK
ncbi:MAG: TolC family protein [Bacteroidales bacterium]|nr:TolC family protein [Bacteroidales bacterium]